jgi:tetratricopeptide (TPR) repeat protein
MADEPESLSQSDRSLFEAGLLSYNKKQFAAALSKFSQMSENKNPIMKYFHMGICLVQLGRLDEGLTYYRKINEIPAIVEGIASPQLIYGLYLNMGSILQVLAKTKGKILWEEAVRCYRYALQIDDSDPKVWNNLGNALLDLELYHEAEDALKKALTFDEEFPEAHYSLSLVYEFTNHLPQAITELEQTLNYRPNNVYVLNRIAGLSLGIGDFSKAKKAATEAATKFPDDANAQKNLALVLYNLGEFTAGMNALAKYKLLNPRWNDLSCADPEVLAILKDLESKAH